MSKLKHNQPSKLSLTPAPQNNSEKTIIIPEKIKMGGGGRNTTPTSFALKEIDKQRIKRLEERIQKLTSKKINTADILRGLLIIGEDIEETILMSNINKSFLE